MWDYDYLQTMSKGIPTIIKYGTTDAADVQGTVQQSEPFLSVSISKGAGLPLIKTQLVGAYNLPNVLVAVTVGKHFNLPDATIQSAIGQYAPSNSRSQLIEKNGNKFILDAYNANPTSMRAAIENFAGIPAANKVLMLGGMAELGLESVQEHEAIIELIKQTPWKAVVLVGGDFMKLDHPFVKMGNSAEAAKWFAEQQFNDTYFLIKGSRSMQMEKVLSPPTP
jgi:UDP-N-acetylmuramoyl-tripeptide--D-alanyl-D-alanine ligase